MSATRKHPIGTGELGLFFECLAVRAGCQGQLDLLESRGDPGGQGVSDVASTRLTSRARAVAWLLASSRLSPGSGLASARSR